MSLLIEVPDKVTLTAVCGQQRCWACAWRRPGPSGAERESALSLLCGSWAMASWLADRKTLLGLGGRNTGQQTAGDKVKSKVRYYTAAGPVATEEADQPVVVKDTCEAVGPNNLAKVLGGWIVDAGFLSE
jgi:hypothetical protein